MTRIETPTGSDQPDPAREAAFQSTDVFAAVGEAPYEWRIDTDALAWGDNATEVLRVADLRQIASGRAFAKLLDLPKLRKEVSAREAEAGDGRVGAGREGLLRRIEARRAHRSPASSRR